MGEERDSYCRGDSCPKDIQSNSGKSIKEEANDRHEYTRGLSRQMTGKDGDRQATYTLYCTYHHDGNAGKEASHRQ